MIYYVNQLAPREGDGSKARPFRSIGEAAALACPGDEVIVAPGVYREYVSPKNGGTEEARIVYRSEVPLGALITGAEIVTGWQRLDNGLWTLASSAITTPIPPRYSATGTLRRPYVMPARYT